MAKAIFTIEDDPNDEENVNINVTLDPPLPEDLTSLGEIPYTHYIAGAIHNFLEAFMEVEAERFNSAQEEEQNPVE